MKVFSNTEIIVDIDTNVLSLFTKMKILQSMIDKFVILQKLPARLVLELVFKLPFFDFLPPLLSFLLSLPLLFLDPLLPLSLSHTPFFTSPLFILLTFPPPLRDSQINRC